VPPAATATARTTPRSWAAPASASPSASRFISVRVLDFTGARARHARLPTRLTRAGQRLEVETIGMGSCAFSGGFEPAKACEVTARLAVRPCRPGKGPAVTHQGSLTVPVEPAVANRRRCRATCWPVLQSPLLSRHAEETRRTPPAVSAQAKRRWALRYALAHARSPTETREQRPL
jgi:hypothetical protein